MRPLIVVLLLILPGCSEDTHPENGVYVSPREVAAFHSEVLELKNGKYRYWMLGDVGPREAIQLSGDYQLKNGRILMEGNDAPPGDREFLVRQTGAKLLRSDASEIWLKERKLHPYGTLIRVPYSFEEMRPPESFNEAEWDVFLVKLPFLNN